MSKLEKGSHYLEDGSIVVGFIISIFLATVSRAFLHPLVSLLISLVCGAILILAIIKLERAGFWRFLGMAFVAVLFAVNAVSCFLEMGMRGEDARPESEVFCGELQVDVDEVVFSYEADGTEKKVVAPAENLGSAGIRIVSKGDESFSVAGVATGSRLVFEGVPEGDYMLQAELGGYEFEGEGYTLRASSSNGGVWNETARARRLGEGAEFRISVSDSDGSLVSGARCDVFVEDSDAGLTGVDVGSDGALPYMFRCASDRGFRLVLHYDGEAYEERANLQGVDGTLDVSFANLTVEKPVMTEEHVPEETAVSVSVSEWGSDDLSVTGKGYAGGHKVSISYLFITWGAGGSEDITSRLYLTLTGGMASNEDDVFEGAFVLDKSMYGTASRGTIRILVDGVEAFTTGEIDATCAEDFPFSVNIAGARSLVVEADVTVEGGPFVYGFVNA